MSSKRERVEAVRVALSYEMPFGRHKGSMLDHIPSGYLQWAAETLEEPICTYADRVWQWRERMGIHWYEYDGD